jgi:hypothetical protein
LLDILREELAVLRVEKKATLEFLDCKCFDRDVDAGSTELEKNERNSCTNRAKLPKNQHLYLPPQSVFF